MRLLLLGGTGFLGPSVYRLLLEAEHSVAVSHRGQTQANLPPPVEHVLGDRKGLPAFVPQFRRLAPQVVIDLIG